MPDDDWRKNTLYSIDPFPDIAPSLLNSADIIRYGEAGCLVDRFCKCRLNPATYTMRFLGTLYRWESRDNRLCRQQQEITKGTRVTIWANSISYLLTGEQFRLPAYIAARFNLHIRYVHKGILLGTGPLVDPGFAGPLLVPLHNLTDNDYEVEGGDNLLWVEFTKLTRHSYWSRPLEQQDDLRPDELVPFKGHKYQLDAKEYFAKAGVSTKHGVQSAFKGALEKARKSAKAAQKAVNVFTIVGLAGFIGALIGLFALLFAAWQLWQGNVDMASRIDERLDRIERAIGPLPPATDASPMQDAESTFSNNQPAAQDAETVPESAQDDTHSISSQ